MGYLKIDCGCCGHSWNVYRSTMELSSSRICPFCGHKIALETYHNKICKAFDTMQEANLELYSDNAEHHQGKFNVSYIEFLEKDHDIMGRLDALEERMENMATDAVLRAYEIMLDEPQDDNKVCKDSTIQEWERWKDDEDDGMED